MKIKRGYKQTEIGIIPKDWDCVKIGEFTDVIAGGTPNTNVPSYWGGDILWMSSGELNEKRIFSVKGRITEHGLNNSSSHLIPPSCVLVGLAGQGKTRGTVALNYVQLCTNQSIAAIIPNDSFVSEYLYQNLEHRYKELREASAGDGGRGGLNTTIIKNLICAVPPLPEQSAIAHALGDADALISSLGKLITKKRQIKQGAMQELLTGKRRLEGFPQEYDFRQTEIGDIPADWDCVTLGDICSSITDGTHYTPKYVESGIPFYSVENVTGDDFINVKFISKTEHIKLLKRCKPEKGDILLARIGAIGDTKLITWDVDASIYVSLALLKVKEIARADYLYCYTKSAKFISELEDRSLMNASPKKINMGEIGRVLIMLPSLPEQVAIAKILTEMDDDIAATEQKLEKYHKIKQGMMQELLTGRTRLV